MTIEEIKNLLENKLNRIESAIKVNEDFDKGDLFNRDSIIEVVPF